MFTCNRCEFGSKYKNCFRRHINSNKHHDVCSDANACHLCLKQFQTKSGYSKHMRKCNVDICPMTQKRKIGYTAENSIKMAVREELIRSDSNIAKIAEQLLLHEVQ
jgi:hypothetical protein